MRSDEFDWGFCNAGNAPAAVNPNSDKTRTGKTVRFMSHSLVVAFQGALLLARARNEIYDGRKAMATELL